MNVKGILLFLFVATVLYACQGGEKKIVAHTITMANDTLTYHTDTTKVISVKANQNADGEAFSDTSYAYVKFPVFDEEKVNSYLLKAILPLVEDTTVSSYRDLASDFIQKYNKEFVSGFTPTHHWFMDLRVKVVHQLFEYVAIESTHTNFMGGAHPNTYTLYLNFNPKTLKTINLDDLIQAEKKQELIKVAEEIFRKDEKLSSTEKLDKYFFDKGKFSLPDNFYVSEKGLQFLYNHYEIKPYADGQTILIIPFNRLKDIAKPNTILSADTNL